MTGINLLGFLALSVASYPAVACEIGDGTILAIPSDSGRAALLDVRMAAEGREASACLQLAGCSWKWNPSGPLVDSIRRSKFTAEDCEQESALVNDVDHARRLECKPSAPVARPFFFVDKVLSAQRIDQCPSTRVTATSDSIHAEAEVRRSSLMYCVDLRWSFPTTSLLVSFAPTCDFPRAPESWPESSITIRVSQPKVSIAFGVNPYQGKSWALESVSTAPSTPYLSRWARIMRSPRRRRSHRRGCDSAWNKGSDAHLMTSGIDEPDHAGLQEIDFASAVHLALDQLELGDLTLGLTVRPG